MQLKELLKQSASLIGENNILDDVIYPSSTVQNIIEKMSKIKKIEDLLIVAVDEENKLLGYVTLLEVKAFIDEVARAAAVLGVVEKKTNPDWEPKWELIGTLNASTLNWGIISPNLKQVVLSKTATIADVIRTLTAEELKTDIVFLEEEGGQYAGKIRRASALATIRKLLGA